MSALYAIDTNLLVYAHNTTAPFHTEAKSFIEKAFSNYDISREVCIPAQVLVEFLNVITWSKIGNPLPLDKATIIVQRYIASGVPIIHPQATQLTTLFSLLEGMTTRKKIFDVALAATLKDNNIKGLYTINVKDFKEFGFLDVVNPLAIN
ncbi:type II toxin-antitoxin system VapC family toxin [Thiofilum flexile]|uniref:type II toxin-antitoxin system VapC family toxin n=1 Tax=Thiofilum flexile TaxID=125627 RepID=UPI000372C543|nr:PIN domain-containing protein [Thiofilum flexile]